MSAEPGTQPPELHGRNEPELNADMSLRITPDHFGDGVYLLFFFGQFKVDEDGGVARNNAFGLQAQSGVADIANDGSAERPPRILVEDADFGLDPHRVPEGDTLLGHDHAISGLQRAHHQIGDRLLHREMDTTAQDLADHRRIFSQGDNHAGDAASDHSLAITRFA